ncbi:hypothetical protein AMELA_G00111070 [Ameiurus melas]|uniref:Uncharacterized protein n=1 Tax=Ameiurus melas TaxID=219545 RepID=A0A7J6AQ31_AMEME|nr:hypothetical protein AMELA_G00111070 [Ameiurus melas]
MGGAFPRSSTHSGCDWLCLGDQGHVSDLIGSLLRDGVALHLLLDTKTVFSLVEVCFRRQESGIRVYTDTVLIYSGHSGCGRFDSGLG